LLKIRNWKIYDFQIFQIGRSEAASEKLGIGKSMIFKYSRLGRSEEVIIFLN
tara:strand:- start:6703 stop:6858 length:156 start_codon:yes stop_codon:yes gene_type:complete